MKCMTWNIMYEKHSKYTDISYEERLETILKKLMDYEYSIICLQEVHLPDVEKDFGVLEKHGYQIVKNQIGKRHNSEMGNVIFLRKDVWKVDSVFNSSSGIHLIAFHTEVKKPLWVSNVHLKAGYTTGRKRRKEQVTSNIKRIDKNYHGFRVLLCGDFNDELFPLDGPLASLLRSDDYIIKVNPPSWFNGLSFHCFDHAIGKNIKVEYEDTIWESDSKIPNKEIPSDHLPVVFKIEL